MRELIEPAKYKVVCDMCLCGELSYIAVEVVYSYPSIHDETTMQFCSDKCFDEWNRKRLSDNRATSGTASESMITRE